METQGRIISASEATIRTFAIDVRVIKINNRQMTQSVFRQLPSRHVIDLGTGLIWEDAILWGTVNYHWGVCPDENHLHIVWQCDGTLYRAMEINPSSVDKYVSVRPKLRTLYEGDEKYYNNYLASWMELIHLNQLFIAV